MKRKLIVFCCSFISSIVLGGCGQPKAPDETDIKDAVIEYNLMDFSQEVRPNPNGNTITMSNIDMVQINRQQTESKSNITYCTIEMSNDDCRVVVDCIYNFEYYDNKKWYPENQEIESLMFYPLNGVNEELAYETTIKNLHAESESFNDFFLGEDYTYDSVYTLQLREHTTDLENYLDKLIYDYSKSSDFCTESGVVETYYVFDSNNGSWVYSNILDDELNYEYHPEGQWRFDIYTHYYRINISNVDYTNNTAFIYYKDSSWQSEADNGELQNYIQVSFTITDDGMSFSPFHVVSHGVMYTTKQDVYLLLKKDNMYVSDDGLNYRPVTWSRYVN